MNCLVIDRRPNGHIVISAEVDGITYAKQRYIDYYEIEAIKRYRQQFDLVGKKLTRIYI